MKTHDEAMRLLPRYETLAAGERADVDEHLAGCRVCAARLAIYQYAERARAGAGRVESGAERARPAFVMPLLALGVLAILAVGLLAARGDLSLRSRPNTLLQPAPAITRAPVPAIVPALLPPTPAPVPASGSMAWLREHAAAFRGVEPGDLTDLAPLEKMIGRAQLVVIGDPTFGGAHETLAMRERLLELLVERMGFSTVLVETPADTGERINAFIQGGAGAPDDPSLGIDGVPLTQEWLYTLRWLREHDANPGNAPRVALAGFLPPLASGQPMLEAITVYLSKVAAGADLSAVFARSNQQLVDWLQGHRYQYIARSSKQDYDHALLAAESLAQYEQLAAADVRQRALLVKGFEMSNLNILLDDAANERVLVWRTSADPLLASAGSDSYLRALYGDRAVFVTFDFYRGALYAYPSVWPGGDAPLARSVHVLPSAPAGSYEAWLHADELPRLALDLRAAPGSGDARGETSLPALPYVRLLQAGIDACYAEDNFVRDSPASQGDILVFFDQVTPPTFLSPRQPGETAACPAGPQNLDFAAGTQGWLTTDPQAGYETAVSGANGREAYVRSRKAPTLEPGSGVLAQSFLADDYRGKRVRVALTAGAGPGADAMLWLEAERPAFQSQAYVTEPLPQAAPRQPYELVLDVPDNAIRITFGVQLRGQGEVTLRDVMFEVVN